MGNTGISRRRVLAVLATPVAISLAGCRDDHPGHALGYSTGRGRAADSAPLHLRNIVGVSAQPGSGTLLATIFNDGPADDALLELSVREGTSRLEPSPVPIPARSITVLGLDTSLGTDPATAVLRGQSVKAGYVVHLGFRFERAAPLTNISVLVQGQSGPYANVPLPTAAPR